MQEHKYRNQGFNIFVIVFVEIVTLLCIQEVIRSKLVFMILAGILAILGVLYLYHRFTYRIIITDEALQVGIRKIPWVSIKTGVLSMQARNSEHGSGKYKVVSIIYKDDHDRQKTVSLIPSKMTMPDKLYDALSKKIEIVDIRELHKVNKNRH